MGEYRMIGISNKIENLKFSEVNINDPIFDSLKQDYPRFKKWFEKKRDETLYSVKLNNQLAAILYLKLEPFITNNDITPSLKTNRKLKIGTFKVQTEGRGIGSEFMKFIFDQANQLNVEEIYVTVHNESDSHKKFISFIKNFGFKYHGYKGKEEVYTKIL